LGSRPHDVRQIRQAILTLHERSSRLLIAARPPGKPSKPIVRMIASLLTPLPQPLRRSITFDNGTEFARHYDLHRHDIATFFCDPYAPWQKGGIENAIGRIRRAMPRKTDLALLTAKHLQQSSRPTTTPRENALTGIPRPKPSVAKCCTSNVNPPPRLRGDERESTSQTIRTAELQRILQKSK
jgi:hypothetical protein